MGGFVFGETADPQIAGVHDDGTDEGSVRARIVRGDLVRVPFRNNDLSFVQNGISTASMQFNGLHSNDDGSGTGVFLSAKTGLTNGCGIKFTLYGPVFGLRWQRGASGYLGVIIDGVAYPVRQLDKLQHNLAAGSDNECLWIVAEDLDPGMAHTVEIYLTVGDLGANKSLTLYGYIAARSAGYQDLPRLLMHPTTPVASVPAAATAITGISSSGVRAHRKVFYANTDAVARKVTLKASGSVFKVLYLAAAGTAGDSGEVDFGDLYAAGTTITHEADAAGVVNFLEIGGS